ncbi:unnamed protein product [Effrenium voratum]|nr:unnamed protein product [Effrenium voratum]
MVSMGVGVAAGDGQHPAPLKMDEPYKCLDSPPTGAKQVLAITQPVRSANNVIQPSLDESPPASPTDKNLHSSKSDNALSTFLNDLPDSSRRLNWVERLKVYMDYMAGALVLMNSVAMLLEFELEGRQTGKFIGLLENVQAEAEWTATLKFFRALDAVFVFTFLAEWLVRVYLDRKKFLKDFANWFDTLCVLSGIADLILRVSVDSTASRSVVVLRLMRALKSLRAIRMVRSLRFFRGLRVLVQACQCFLPSLCWSMVLLGVFMTMGALMMGNLLQAFILDENLELADRQWLWSRYGTAYRATYTLFEITFAGNWPTSVRPVLDMASHAFVFFFAFYVTVVVFAVIRVISAVFLKDTFDAAQNDAEQQVIDKLRLKAQYVNKLEAIFQAIDETGRGMISQERLTNILANPKVAAYFETLGLDVHEGRALFHLLDNGDGEVTLDEFIDGIMRCKGNARAIDQVAMHADLKMLDRKISKLYRALKKADQGKNPAKSQASHLKVFRIDASTTLKAEDAF